MQRKKRNADPDDDLLRVTPNKKAVPEHTHGLSVQDLDNGSSGDDQNAHHESSGTLNEAIPVEIVVSSSDSESDVDTATPILNTRDKETTHSRNRKTDYESSDTSESDSELSVYEYDEDGDEEFDFDPNDTNIQLPPLKEIKVTKKLSSRLRLFLKREGFSKFLEVFLPSSPTSSDVFMLVKLLGYIPPRVSSYASEDQLMSTAIAALRLAINKSNASRSRLENFYKIEHFTNALRNAKKILVLTGAGISTSLGIPDFRSSKGIYNQLQNFGLDDPQDVFSLELFKRDPSIFYSIAYMILPPENSFTPLHGFIKLLQDKGKLLRNYTQNIDNLEGNVGLLPENVIQCHGSFATATCITCRYRVPGETLYPNIRARKIAYCPFCESERKMLIRKYDKYEDEGLGSYSPKFQFLQSFGVMKPDITFFGENLPERYHSTIKNDVKECDLLITIGTSLKVAPVSEIVNKIDPEVPQVLINRDPINHCEFDVEILGYCDQAITYICGKEMDWQINHPDFNKILNSGLELTVIDEQTGRYKVSDEKERAALLPPTQETISKQTI
ncbi:hypothetical protein CANINC_000555 [Pichia inconspicua]|uniref:Deacetylase sirtuin-type domain-containing protein n=1 Tax=Pichia inconspicua TaxID=52247 RepID=A0A4T0X5V5_9ASCO|nr:hypothetical protein CANINC_000555 [[Candida] inconspicua]